MKKIGAALAAVLVCAGPAVAAKPPKGGPPNPNLTISASATRVTFGRSITISGTTKNVAPGTTITLQQNPYPYTGFKATGKTGVVDPGGGYTIPGVTPLENTQYRIEAKTKPPSDSAAVFVHVRLRVSFHVSDRTPRRGQRVRFYGTVAPAQDGKPVLIQRKTSSGYRTIARTTLRDNGTATSKYSRRVRIRRSGRYRVVAESLSQAYDNGVSTARTLRVH